MYLNIFNRSFALAGGNNFTCRGVLEGNREHFAVLAIGNSY